MSAGAGENSNANVMQVTVQDVHATKRHGVEVRLRLALSSHGERSLRQIDPHDFSGPVHRVPQRVFSSATAHIEDSLALVVLGHNAETLETPAHLLVGVSMQGPGVLGIHPDDCLLDLLHLAGAAYRHSSPFTAARAQVSPAGVRCRNTVAGEPAATAKSSRSRVTTD